MMSIRITIDLLGKSHSAMRRLIKLSKEVPADDSETKDVARAGYEAIALLLKTTKL
jgi:hypothetical protein